LEYFHKGSIFNLILKNNILEGRTDVYFWINCDFVLVVNIVECIPINDIEIYIILLLYNMYEQLMYWNTYLKYSWILFTNSKYFILKSMNVYIILTA